MNLNCVLIPNLSLIYWGFTAEKSKYFFVVGKVAWTHLETLTITYLFYIQATVSPLFFPANLFPSSYLCLLPGKWSLPWVKTKYSIAGCSKSKHRPIH